MTTTEAFDVFMNDPDLMKKAGLNELSIRVLRHQVKNGKISEHLMSRRLLAAGFQPAWIAPEGYKKAEVETPAV